MAIFFLYVIFRRGELFLYLFPAVWKYVRENEDVL